MQAGSASSGAAASPTGSSAASPEAGAPAGQGAASTAAAAAHLLQQLQLAVGAELSKPLAEQQLLRHCNEAAAARYQQLADDVAAACGRLQEQAHHLQQQQLEGGQEQLAGQAGRVQGQQQEGLQLQGGRLGPLLDELEAQVQALEATVAQLDASSRRLQGRLAAAGAAPGSDACA